MNWRENWLKRWLHTDNRKAMRQGRPSLVAHYWTGGVPRAIGIRDISPAGLFLLTDEPWYIGTLIKLTLQRTEQDENPQRLITVRAAVVRCAPDGIGLAFVLQGTPHSISLGLERLADQRAIERFLKYVKTNDTSITIEVEQSRSRN